MVCEWHRWERRREILSPEAFYGGGFFVGLLRTYLKRKEISDGFVTGFCVGSFGHVTFPCSIRALRVFDRFPCVIVRRNYFLMCLLLLEKSLRLTYSAGRIPNVTTCRGAERFPTGNFIREIYWGGETHFFPFTSARKSRRDFSRITI